LMAAADIRFGSPWQRVRERRLLRREHSQDLEQPLRQTCNLLLFQGKPSFHRASTVGAKREIAGPNRVGWGVSCRVIRAVPQPGRRRLAGPGRRRLARARTSLLGMIAKLAPVLRLTTQVHWPQEGTTLKTQMISRPFAWLLVSIPAESAGWRVSLCRAET
jgi:hypothetical protein